MDAFAYHKADMAIVEIDIADGQEAFKAEMRTMKIDTAEEDARQRTY